MIEFEYLLDSYSLLIVNVFFFFQLNYDFAKGTTPVLKTSIKNFEITEIVRPIASVPMDTA